MDKTGKTPIEVALGIGRARQSVHRYINGQRTPRPKDQKRIAEFTDDKVTHTDWYEQAVSGQ